jgi:serine/threonine-protein kinase
MFPAESVVIQPVPSKVSFGPFIFDRSNGLLRDGSREIPVPPRVLGVLDLLVSRAGTVVPKQELIDTVWKDAFVTDTSLAEAISVLRQALGDDPQSPQYVQTVHRRGYRFVAPIAVVPPSPAEPTRLSVAPSEHHPPSLSSQLVPWGIASLCLMLAVVAVWQYTHFRPPGAPVVRMRIEPASGTVFDTRAPALALSPDGRLLAWSACDSRCRLYMRALDQLDPQGLAGTDGGSAPFFSYDGRWIGFFASGKLQKVAVAGGMPVVITDAAQPFGAVWLPDRHIVFAASERGGLMRVSESGGTVEPLTVPTADAGEVRHSWPALAPGERALLFTIATSPHDEAAPRIGLLSINQRSAWQTIVENAEIARAVSSDYIAFSRANEIHAVAFDRARQAIAGADQAVIDGVAPAQFAVARSGAIVYSMAADGATRPSLTWIPSGQPVSNDLAALQDLNVTSDGSRVAGVSGSDIWVADMSRETTTRLTHGGTNVGPVWSGDGSAVYYAATSGGVFEAWTRDSSGTQPAKRLLSAARQRRNVFPSSVSRDGQLMAYTESGGPTRGDVKVINVGTGATVAAIETPFDETHGVLSPDARSLAYQSDESGRWEVYVLKLDDRQRIPISSAGGREPRWAPDGSTLFYRADAAMRVSIDGTGHPLSAPVAVPLPNGFVVAGVATGNRVLARRSGESSPMRAALTLEWARDLQRIIGPPATALPR